MAARARSNGKAPSAADRRRAKQAAAQAEREAEAQQALLPKLQNSIAHLRSIKGQRAEIADQRTELAKRDEVLAEAQQQVVGRIVMLEELLGQREPLADITQLTASPAEDPTEVPEAEAVES